MQMLPGAKRLPDVKENVWHNPADPFGVEWDGAPRTASRFKALISAKI